MGKHKEKSKKGKSRKHRKEKKRKTDTETESSTDSEEWIEKKPKYSRRNSSSSEEEKIISKRKTNKKKQTYSPSSGSSSSSDEWMEKTNQNDSENESKYKITDKIPILENIIDSTEHSKGTSDIKREDWLSMQPSSFLTASNLDRRREREERKRLENEKSKYDPRKNVRELNPYWKDGGDGLPSLPKFKKPEEDVSRRLDYKSNILKNRTSSWRKKPSSSEKETDDKSYKEKTYNWKKLSEARGRSEISGNDYKFERQSAHESKEEKHRRDDRYKEESDHLRSENKDKQRREGSCYNYKDSNRREYHFQDDRDKKSESFKEEGSQKKRDENERYTKNRKHKIEENSISYDVDDLVVKEDKSGLIFENMSQSSQTKSDINTPSVLSDKEMNVLAAKLVKAEIMGNMNLAEELRKKLELARKMREQAPEVVKNTEEEVVLTRTDTKGYTRPVMLQSDFHESSVHKKKKQNVETHKDGKRVCYFADDDKYSLKQMFENEKFNSVEEQNSQFAKLAGKIRKNDDMDDIFSDNIRKKESDAKIDQRNKEKAISEHLKVTKSLESCHKCIQSNNMVKHLMITMGENMYLTLPSYEPMADGHCLIVPIRHVSCGTQLDENEWEELLNFRRAIVRMFASQGDDVLFFETAMGLHRFPHMTLECVPIAKEQGDLAPIYFKKAIDESETEWANNKKLVSLSGKDVRKCVPKGLPYFCVSFGMQEGYAHVIEDEQYFPKNFAQEIIGGILDLHHSKWRNPKKQKFEEQSKRVLDFSKLWKNYDITHT